MPTYVALLRAVNVGGTGRLAMADLRAMCATAGFSNVETYIASGNVVFSSPAGAASAKAALEASLERYAGKPVGVAVRTAREMADILAANPFEAADPSRTYVLFLDAPPPRGALAAVTGRTDEQLHLGRREIYIAYPNGMGRSRLRVPAAKEATARNVNTVAALVEMASRPTREPPPPAPR
jgi:uncharacterized protein (DUF1697 family)